VWRDQFEVIEHAPGCHQALCIGLARNSRLPHCAGFEFPSGRGFESAEQFDERGFTGSVHADQGNALAAFNDEIHILEDVLFTVGFRQTLGFHDDASAGLWLRELEVNGGFFFRHFDPFDLLKLLDAALHLLGFCSLRAETVDEQFKLFDLVTLGFYKRK